MLVTGSSGLIGSEVCADFAHLGYAVHGWTTTSVPCSLGHRATPAGTSSRWSEVRGFTHHELDIRDARWVLALVRTAAERDRPHAAAQPSHDRAAAIPFDDFDTNAVGTLNLLEAARRSCPESPFVHMSTNKVYGDDPTPSALTELATDGTTRIRLRQRNPRDFPIDQSKHSLFGARKVAADVMVQEYGRYFGMPTCCLRGGCLTGPNHSGVELHGFLSYLVKCNLEGREYRVFGYKGKQVRDNIHTYDVARFIHEFCEEPAGRARSTTWAAARRTPAASSRRSGWWRS